MSKEKYDNINYRLNSNEQKVYSEWWNKKNNRVSFQADLREEILEYLKKRNDGIKIEEVGDIIYPRIRAAWWASSSTQFHVINTAQDELKIQLSILQKGLNFLINYFIQETGLENIKQDDKFFEMPNVLKIYQRDLEENLKLIKNKRMALGKKYEKWVDKNEYLGFKDTKVFTMDNDKLDYKDFEENWEEINEYYKKGDTKDEKQN